MPSVDPQMVLRQHVAARICQVSGGACKDPATSLDEIRGRVTANSAQWSQTMNDFRMTLDSRKIPKNDQEEVMTALTDLMHDVSGMNQPTSVTRTSTSTMGTMPGNMDTMARSTRATAPSSMDTTARSSRTAK
jgi:hypothetical protein